MIVAVRGHRLFWRERDVQLRFAICLAVALSLPALAGPASAQYVLPPHEITTSVRSIGLQPVSRPVLRANGARYVLHAIDRRGVEVRVVADAMTGRVLAARPLGYPAGPAYAVRPYGPEYYRPVPPRGIPEAAPSDPRVPPTERSARIPSDPPIIYAPGSKPEVVPAPRPPVAGKPAAAPKVAAKPKPTEPPKEKAANQSPAETDTTGTTSSSSAENSSVAIPPVQSLE